MRERFIFSICVVGLLGTAIFLGLVDTGIFSDPSDKSQTYIDRGKAKAGEGEYFEAISDYDMAISLNPDNAKYYHYRGEAKAALKQYGAAIVDYNGELDK